MTSKWKIESGVDFVTGSPKWVATPPRFIYRSHGEAKRSFDTYDEALAHVRSSRERRPLVFESKTRIGEWFWLNPDGASGWERDRVEAHHRAGHASTEVPA